MRGPCLAGPLPGPPARPRPSPGPGFRFCFLLFSAPALPSCHARCQPGLPASQCRSHGAAAAAGRAACQCQTDRRRRRVLSRRQFITNRTLHANKVHGWRPVTRRREMPVARIPVASPIHRAAAVTSESRRHSPSHWHWHGVVLTGSLTVTRTQAAELEPTVANHGRIRRCRIVDVLCPSVRAALPS